jgi:hypothetical protein
MGLQAQPAEKLAECLGSHASFEAEHKQCGHDQADEPGAACLCLSKRRLRGAVSAIDRLQVSMHTTFGKPSAICQTPDALLTVLTHRVENDNALGPQSHGVGPCSGGWLTSRKSALQSTRSTATCPALRGCPKKNLLISITSLYYFAYVWYQSADHDTG